MSTHTGSTASVPVFYDPFANDQDWALVYYLLANDDL